VNSVTNFSLSEAATATGKSRSTIRRALDAGRFPTAFRDFECGEIPPPWQVPIEDLHAAGFTTRKEVLTQHRRPHVSPGLSAELASLRQTCAVAVAVADERLRQIEQLTAQVAALTTILAARLTGSASDD
jgi:hypothetical protein